MRGVFFSFDWSDAWRANQVRHSWVTKGGQRQANFRDVAEIETVRKSSDVAIKHWIDEQLNGTSVTCVLIGSDTYSSKWVAYEIEQSLARRNGLLGIYIDGLRNAQGRTAIRGQNPLSKSLLEANVKHVAVSGLKWGAGAWAAMKLLPPPVSVPLILAAAGVGAVAAAFNCLPYDWVDDDGYHNLANWIELAARQAGR